MILLFGVFFLLLFLGTPVSFSMLASSIIYMIVYDLPLKIISQRLAAGVDSFPLLAVAFFVLAGNIMNSGSITTRIFSFANKLVGHFTGGLAHANVLASTLFAGMSGSALADTGGMGAIEIQAMRDHGYDDDLTLAVTGASSLIGPIIPPSVPMVVFGVAAEVSVGDLFSVGLIPGLIMCIGMMVLNYIICRKKNYTSDPKATLKQIWWSFKWAFFSLLLIFIIRGTISLGVCTPTEASIVAVIYALILGFAYKTINIKMLPNIFRETLDMTVGILFIISCATIFSYVLTFSQVPQTITRHLMALTSNPLVGMLIMVVILLFAGLFLDVAPAIVLLVPVLQPFARALGIDMVMFGLIVVLSLVVGLITPPVGTVLYVLSSISGCSVERISKAILPYVLVCMSVILLAVIYTYLMILFPGLPKIY